MEGKKINYCKRCVMPDTKPELYFDQDGICNACRNFENRKEINWIERENKLIEILDKYKSKDGSNYDCLIPVSGGKDSTFQTIKMLEYGMNPLCVTATTDKLSSIGRNNIENIKKLGVDYIEVSTNPVIRRKINKIALTQVGDISWPEHVTIFTIPVRISVQLKIPLIIWGENSQHEYGGPAGATESNILNRKWLEEFGGLNGLRVSDLMLNEEIEKKHLIQYSYPTDEDLKEVGVTGLFLGYYLPWDGPNNAFLAQAYGFQSYHKVVEGSIVNYENLDNLQMRVHDYFKYLKFGYDRVSDWVSIYIRRGRLSRKHGIELVKRYSGKFPESYLGCSLNEILDEIDISEEEFIKICDRYTNKKVFQCDAKGILIKDRHGNLFKNNFDNI
jgi:N-acetyl sugar amidotransferase